jgi:tetratricopeptide (TPR) repeat protein
MQRYGVREVEKLLRLPRSAIRSLIEAGFVSPERGPRKAWLFSFQDLIALRTAQALVAANVPRRRITRSVRELRRHLPQSMPLSGLSICAVADRVVVREGGRHWQADSGQYLLAFEGDPANGSLRVIEPPRAAATEPTADDWLGRALELEADDPEAALQAYAKAIAADPKQVEAHINRACLLHETGRLPEAEQAYRAAIETCGKDALLLYNFGVLLQDLKRPRDAMQAYADALEGDPRLADCHYNLALLCEELEMPRDAIRHMAHYRRLVKTK